MQERVKPAGKRKAEPKTKKVTLAVDAKLAADAAEKGIDLVAALEQTLRRLLGGNERSLSDADREALEWAERYMAEHGPWWDDSEKI